MVIMYVEDTDLKILFLFSGLCGFQKFDQQFHFREYEKKTTDIKIQENKINVFNTEF